MSQLTVTNLLKRKTPSGVDREGMAKKHAALKGKIRVAKYDFKTRQSPTTIDQGSKYSNVIIHVKDDLSPYGRLMENLWQFSKLYPSVAEQNQTVHRWTSEKGWTWPSEVHYTKEELAKNFKGNNFKDKNFKDDNFKDNSYDGEKKDTKNIKVDSEKNIRVDNEKNIRTDSEKNIRADSEKNIKSIKINNGDSKTDDNTLDYNLITPSYWKWRDAGQRFRHPVRYPNGYGGRSKCMSVVIYNEAYDEIYKEAYNEIYLAMSKTNLLDCRLVQNEVQLLRLVQIITDYLSKKCNKDHELDLRAPIKFLGIVQGRALVYFKTYARLARQHPAYAKLKKRFEAGENLQIAEVDGPPLDAKNVPPFECVVNGSIEVNKYVVQSWLRSRYSFGHGICLAVCLMDADEWVYECIN